MYLGFSGSCKANTSTQKLIIKSSNNIPNTKGVVMLETCNLKKEKFFHIIALT